MDIKDATLVMLSESADHPAVASIAQSVYDRLANNEPVGYRLLDQRRPVAVSFNTAPGRRW